jgi:hypothetical protein
MWENNKNGGKNGALFQINTTQHWKNIGTFLSSLVQISMRNNLAGTTIPDSFRAKDCLQVINLSHN